MLQRKGNQYTLHPHEITINENGNERTTYALPSVDWWEKVAEKHDHIKIVGTKEIEVTEAMQERYEEIKRMPEDFTSMYIDYVKDGTLPDGEEVSIPKNHPFNLIIAYNQSGENAVDILSAMDAMTEVYEKNLSLESENTNVMLAVTELYEEMNKEAE
ncbi:hypothetical protein [Alkalicoccus chagannorensis]|uniref:hypothetical protein n=1 Tax=Alkalicoccus chagannorensis TaxID=427072 RepID=UPI00041540CD|nr:hypothetical protein [Alkalicoccus chagannorensis]